MSEQNATIAEVITEGTLYTRRAVGWSLVTIGGLSTLASIALIAGVEIGVDSPFIGANGLLAWGVIELGLGAMMLHQGRAAE